MGSVFARVFAHVFARVRLHVFARVFACVFAHEARDKTERMRPWCLRFHCVFSSHSYIDISTYYALSRSLESDLFTVGHCVPSKYGRTTYNTI